MNPQDSAASHRYLASARWVGIGLGVIISLGLLATIYADRVARIESGRRHSTAVALGVDRLLRYEMRNLERALHGLAADADAQVLASTNGTRSAFPEMSKTVLSRHAELEGIDLYAADGRLVHHGIGGAPPLSDFAATLRGPEDGLRVATLRDLGSGRGIIPVAWRTPQRNLLVARLSTREMDSMLYDLDIAARGSAAILHPDGMLLARRGPGPDNVGRKVPFPASVALSPLSQVEFVSPLDGIKRLSSFSSTSGYPLVTAAGISQNEVLAPWRSYASLALILLLLYWTGVAFLVRRMASVHRAREKTLEELERYTRWLLQAQEASRSGVWAMEAGQENVQVSAHAAKLFDFPPASSELPLEGFFSRIHPEDRDRVQAEFAAARERELPFHSEYRIVLPGGQRRWISARGALVADGNGQQRMTGTIVDISDRKHAQEKSLQTARQFRVLFELNPLPFWVFDIQTLRFLAVNQTAIDNYGYSREEFLAMTILQVRPEQDAKEVVASVEQQVEPRLPELWTHITKSGKRLQVRVHSSSIQFANRAARLVLAEDVSERMAYERDLAWRATHDDHTALLKLRALIQRLDLVAGQHAPRYALAYVQLRDLELVSPTFGRRIGEAIVAEVARRFSRVAEKYGHAAHVPAEAFVVVAMEAARLDAMVAELIEALAQPVNLESGSHRVEAWIGIARWTGPGQDAEQVVGHAALAALQARAENAVVMPYQQRMTEHASARLATVARLRGALAERRLEVFYQPIARIDDGTVVAVEALLRWPQADGSFVSPAEFIPLAEESGLIVPLGEWVLEQAALAHGELSKAGLGGIAIAVNVSAVQFLAGSLPSTLRALRERHGLSRAALHVELTESAMLRQPEVVRATMDELRREGVCMAIDDFGTGFSSMTYLRQLPVDQLKLDRSFVHDVHCDPRNAAICRALIGLGHGLGLGIIAEGVENAEQLAWLKAHGCDQAQGYYLGRPAPLTQLMAFVLSPRG